VRTTGLALQRTWLAYLGSVIVILRTACERRADATVFTLAATTAATGAMLLVRHVHRVGEAAHGRRSPTIRPQAVGLTTGALLTCALALPVLHALTPTSGAARPHASRRQIPERPRAEATAPPAPLPELAPVGTSTGGTGRIGTLCRLQRPARE
jgi:hypothetical protein